MISQSIMMDTEPELLIQISIRDFYCNTNQSVHANGTIYDKLTHRHINELCRTDYTTPQKLSLSHRLILDHNQLHDQQHHHAFHELHLLAVTSILLMIYRQLND